MNRRLLIAVITFGFAGGVHAQAPASSAGLPVTADRLTGAASEPQNWLTYSGTYNGQRYSRLDQISGANADRLEIKWVYQLQTLNPVETTPLVVDGVMYVTQSPSNVIALDAATGRPYWTYAPELPDDLRICCGAQNRGVAILGDRVFVGTLDARLIALDAATGNVLWEAKVDDHDVGYSITGAPLAVKDMIVTGIAGGEYGIRGYIDAYDAATGERRWRHYTIPGPGEPGNETWSGDSWRTGGAPTWITGSYDPELNLIYWGTGNPGPDWNVDVREGDNLCADCFIALNADTGEEVWHFQFTPHDGHDWDATQVPVLIDAEVGGITRKLVVTANRNAFYYVLDRETGAFITAQPFAEQTWAERIQEDGRPIRIPGKFPTEEGVVVSPSVYGGTNWWSPSYSPSTGLFYIMSLDGAQTYFKGDADYTPGNLFIGGNASFEQPPETYRSALRALDGTTGDLRWEYEVQPLTFAGVLSTAGNVVFSGAADGFVFALDAETGEVLWNLSLGGAVVSGPMSYAVDGNQYVTISAGNSVFTFGLR